MSGPQGYDPTQPWQPQPGQGEQQAAAETQWASTPAYPPAQYPQYQQPSTGYPAAPQYPAAPGYRQPEQYGQQPYGQPPQPYGQPGGYGQPPQPYGQPGGYGQFPVQPAGRSRKGLIIGLAVALAAVGLLTAFVWPAFAVKTRLDINKAQDGVQQILSDETNGYGAKNVKDVKCNDGQDPLVKKNDTFDCEVSIDGTKRKVTVTFRDDKGTYEVGRPN